MKGMDVTIVEVSPRDGLQNEPCLLSTEAKVEPITRLVAAGARRVEAVLFVHPRLVPAMADAEAVMERVPRADGVPTPAWCSTGAASTGPLPAGSMRSTWSSASATPSTGATRTPPLTGACRPPTEVLGRAREHGLFTTLTLATSFGCPFEGEVDPGRVVELAARGAVAGAQELCLADTIGVGVPSPGPRPGGQGPDAVGAGRRCGSTSTPRNTGFANAVAVVEHGAMVLDASAGGIGGCPFAPEATGPIATDDLVFLLERMGLATGYDLEALLPTAAFLGAQLGHEVPALLPRAGPFPPAPVPEA